MNFYLDEITQIILNRNITNGKQYSMSDLKLCIDYSRNKIRSLFEDDIICFRAGEDVLDVISGDSIIRYKNIKSININLEELLYNVNKGIKELHGK